MVSRGLSVLGNLVDDFGKLFKQLVHQRSVVLLSRGFGATRGMGQEPIHYPLGQFRRIVGGIDVSSVLLDAFLRLFGWQTVASKGLQIVVPVAAKQGSARREHAGHGLATRSFGSGGGLAGLGQAFLELFFAVGFGDPTGHVARIVQVAAPVKEGIIANGIPQALGNAAAVGIGSDAGFGSGVPVLWVAVVAGRRASAVLFLFGGSGQAVEQFSQSLQVVQAELDLLGVHHPQGRCEEKKKGDW